MQDLPGCDTVVCDVRDEAGRGSLLAACPQPDILINHAPGPPMGDFRQWGQDDWQRALNSNMLSAIELIKGVVDGMTLRGFGRIVNITSQSVRAPMANLDLSNAARAGLTGFVGGVARERRDADVTINNLLPGLFDTVPLRRHVEALAKNDDATQSEVMARFAEDVPLSRLGRPEEFGATCAFLCGRQAGFINGQNILVDGGAFPGLM
jgi:3-oxoacyl-[acyl-carrier protein] reductase